MTRDQFAAVMRRRAERAPTYNGQPTPQNQRLIAHCTQAYPETPDMVALVIFTRDAGMHGSGWWKNPDYERCLHLSLSFRDRATLDPLGVHSKKLAKVWCEAFFPGMTRLLWAEPPFSDVGQRNAVWHYRVFVAEDWRTPILPRGEVYTKRFTELGWKSWSELHGGEKQESAHT